MTAGAAPRTGGNRPIRDSASLAVCERRDGRWHVLMGVRSARHAFYPDALAFPGGAVDPTDWAVPIAGALPAEAERLIALRPRRPMSGRRATAIAAAAIREAYEEAGVLIGGAVAEPPARVPPGWDGFVQRGLAPDLSGLCLFMRAITPPGRTRRFDNRFFAVDRAHVAKALAPEDCPTEELGKRRFLPIDEAIEMEMPRVTRVALSELRDRLATHGTVCSLSPLPFYRMVRGEFICEHLD